MKTRQIHLVARPDGPAKPQHFAVVEAPLPPLAAGQVLVRNQWMSVDPYMRRSMEAEATDLEPWQLHAPLNGPSIGVVIQSRNPRFPEGCVVESMSGWQEHFISDGDEFVPYLSADTAISRRDLTGGVRPQDFLGLLGVASQTGYFGMMCAASLVAGQTAVISSAAGTVGSVACQIARLHGIRVVASAGSDEKAAWLRNVAGADHAFNYKQVAFADAFKQACPDGIDLVLESASPEHLSACLPFMKEKGTILIAGFVGIYERGGKVRNIDNFEYVLDRFLTIKSYPFMDYLDHYDQFVRDMVGWRNSGELVFREQHYSELEQAPQALIDLLAGRTSGKPLVFLGDTADD